MPNPPKFDPVRKRGPGPVRLPAEGRQGGPPAWPLGGRVTAAERTAWADLWQTPQAVAWERLGWTRTVARYCRVMVAAESRDATPALLAQATALEDRLGLTPKSMRLLLWEVTADEVAEQRGDAGVRARIKAVLCPGAGPASQVNFQHWAMRPASGSRRMSSSRTATGAASSTG